MPATVTVWDPLVRLFHWSLAFSFFANYFLTEEGEDWHQWIGYYACAWLVVRVAWGFASSGPASWRAFWPTAGRLHAHWQLLKSRGTHRQLGHSPIGALVMILMMVLMLGLGITGYMMEEIDLFWGEDWVEELHDGIASVLMALVCIHILAAIVESYRLRENLPLSMISGNRKQPTVSDD